MAPSSDGSDKTSAGGDSDRDEEVHPLPIKEIRKKLDIMDHLTDRMLAIPTSPSRYNNVHLFLKILEEQQEQAETLAAKVQRIPQALAETKRDIEKWYDAGIEASDRKAKQETENERGEIV